MVNHPNRSATSTPASNPKPAEILELRRTFQFSQSKCASLVHTSLRAWQQWEAGDRRMHPAFWELFRLKAAQLKKGE